MLREEKIEFQREIEEYLEETKVYDIFEEIIWELVTELPKDPVNFIMEKTKTEKHVHKTEGTIIIGPPLS